MRVFVTGATGFIGTELVKDLIAGGHHVRGLTRSDAGAEQLNAAGAESHRGNLTDLDSLRSGAIGMDAVVNLVFNHGDTSKFAQNAADEIKAIEARKRRVKFLASYLSHLDASELSDIERAVRAVRKALQQQ